MSGSSLGGGMNSCVKDSRNEGCCLVGSWLDVTLPTIVVNSFATAETRGRGTQRESERFSMVAGRTRR